MIGLFAATNSIPTRELQVHRLTVAVAAGVFCAVSLGANLSYGMTIGTTVTEKATYAAASVAADLLKIAVPVLALTTWHRRRVGMTVIALVLWTGAMAWSTSSALGFA